MKKALLTASSKFSRFYLRTLFVLLLLIGVSTSTKAQCIGPYQGFESVPNAASATAVTTMNSAGWQFIGASAATSWVPTNASTSVARSGRAYLRSATTNPTISPAVITPKIQTPETFSFYIRGTIVAGLNYSLSFSDDNKSTWVPITNGATTLTGGNGSFTVSNAVVPALPGATATIPMVLVTVTAAWPADSDGYYFKIEDTRPLFPTSTSGNLQVDDISWTSSVSTDNIIVVPDLNNAATCTVTVPATGTYKYYDVGGSTDAYSDGQSNGIIFAPANASDKVRITFKAFDIISGQETFNVYDSNTIGSGAIGGSPFSGNTIPLAAATPINSYTSTFATGEIATRFTSDGAYRTGNTNNFVGYEIWVECIANSCADPGVPTVGGITSSGATLTWTGSAPVGYEITYTTTASPPAGAGTFVASPTVTGTLSGLAGNTTYYGWVRAKCGASTFSNWVSTATSFTTLCSPVGVPYTENFNGLSGPLPTCTSTSGGSWGTNITNGNLFGNSLGQFFFTKPITLAAATVYKLSYDFSALFGNANFSVYIGTVNDGTMFTTGTLLFNHPAATSSTTNNTFNFTSGAAGTYYIGFYYISRTGGFTQLNLDNIFLDVETCIAPTGVATTTPAPTASTGSVRWTAPVIVPSGGYQYYISTSNTAPTSSSTASGSVASGTNVTIGSLTSNTTYYVWIRSSCGGGVTSVWSSSFATFTTAFVVTTTVTMQNGSNGPSPGSCSVNFFDSGGPTGDYVDNETYTYTFYPATAGSKLKAVFGSFRTENNYDGLMIYSGTTATPANLISSGLPAGTNTATCPAGSFYGTNSPGTVISTDATGALTFVFTTDGSVLFAGWAATLSCVTVPVISSFTPNNNNCATGTTTVTITGNNFTAAGGVNGVFFNGVAAASFNVVNNTTLTAVLPSSGVTTGIISVSNATAIGYSSATFFVNAPKPTTTGVTICTGGSGNLTTSTTCSGYVNSGTTMSGTLTAGSDPVGPILGTSISNTAVCSYNTGVSRNYVGIPFQVSVTGTYTFESSATPAFDSMGYIVRTPYTPGTCSGNWVRGDDDGGAGTFTLISTVLTAGVDYILYTTSWALTSGTLSGPFSWAVTPPAGGQIMLPGAPVMNWYVDNSTATVLGTGNSFNPVGVSGSGLANTNTATTVTYYGACPSNTTCRAATTFVINARPTVSFTAQPGATACTFSNVTYTTQAGQTNYVWTIPGVLNTDYTIVSGGTSTSNTVTLQWLTTGTKTVTINYTNAAGCPATTAVSSTATTVSASGLSTTVTPSSATICANVPQSLTATSGSANFFTWTTTAGSLFTDAACTVAYVPGTNFATVYFKGPASATVTASGTVGGTGCAADTNVAITINKAIWNGTVWSNAGVGPSNVISAEFQGNFTSSVNASATSGNLSACSVIVTSGNVLYDRGTLTVQNTVTVSGGSLVFDDTSLYNVALYQPNNVANAASVYTGGNIGNITFKRTSMPMFRYDYTYWSTPVSGQNLYAMSPQSPFGLFLDYGPGWNYISDPSAVTMRPAKGYAVRAPLGNNISGLGTAAAWTSSFAGVPNSGDISIPISGGAAAMNLLGNPYPSGLSADAFITANPNINGTLYFWTHTSQVASPYQYINNDYAIYTIGGGVGTQAQTSPTGPGVGNNTIPTGFISSGQGFFVKGLTSGSANFTNSMRAGGNTNNSQFYKTNNQQLEKNRYWLEIISPEGAFKQALVGYIETATMGIDRLFDGEIVETGNAVSLYTKVDDTKLSIQGRALPFDIADTVPLSYKSTTATTFTISIPEADGLFTSQHVYLEDRVLNIIHDLAESGYTFATEAGTFEERFVLRYTTQSLGNEHTVFNESSVVVYHNTNGLFINTGNEMMTKVTVFDVSGRLLANQKQVNNTSTVFTTLPTTQQVLLVKIEGESGVVVTKKVVY